MNFSTNYQGLLAEQFFIDEITLNHESYSAVMKIQRWKFILKIPGIGQTIIKEAGTNIQHSFFSFVPTADLIAQIGKKSADSIN